VSFTMKVWTSYGPRENLSLIFSTVIARCGNELHIWRSLLAMTFKKIAGCAEPPGREKEEGRASAWPGTFATIKSATGAGVEAVRRVQLLSAMRQRCYVKTYPAYPNYGGRGIRVCKLCFFRTEKASGISSRQWDRALLTRRWTGLTFKDTMNRPTADGRMMSLKREIENSSFPLRQRSEAGRVPRDWSNGSRRV